MQVRHIWSTIPCVIFFFRFSSCCCCINHNTFKQVFKWLQSRYHIYTLNCISFHLDACHDTQQSINRTRNVSQWINYKSLNQLDPYIYVLFCERNVNDSYIKVWKIFIYEINCKINCKHHRDDKLFLLFYSRNPACLIFWMSSHNPYRCSVTHTKYEYLLCVTIYPMYMYLCWLNHVCFCMFLRVSNYVPLYCLVVFIPNR